MTDSFILILVVLLLTGLFVGFASGLLGVGGGFVMVPVQFWLLSSLGTDPTLALRIAFATSLAVVIPTALSSAYGHHCRKCVLVRPVLVMLIPCIIGGYLGATITTHLPGPWMETVFGVILFLAALQMGTGGRPGALPEGPRPAVPAIYLAAWGLLFGIVSGLLGIGGGIVMVPVMVTLLGFSLHEAIGTSSALMIGSAASGVISYIANGWGVPGLPPWSVGYVDMLQWLPLVAMSIPAAQLGVRTAHRIPREQIRIVFVIVMALTGMYMAASGLAAR